MMILKVSVTNKNVLYGVTKIVTLAGSDKIVNPAY